MKKERINEVNRRFAQRLLRLRRVRGITGVELAAASGLPEQAVYRIEAGGSGGRLVSIGEAVVLADALDVDLMHFVSPEPLDLNAALGAVARV